VTKRDALIFCAAVHMRVQLASLEDSKSRQDAAYHSLAGQLSDLEVMGMQGFPVQQPRAMQHMIQQPQQQQQPPQQSQQQQQQQLLWSGNQSALAMPTQVHIHPSRLTYCAVAAVMAGFRCDIHCLPTIIPDGAI
jgi:transcription initiation factor TFIID subunit TAF12